jgi:hypothetical protein
MLHGEPLRRHREAGESDESHAKHRRRSKPTRMGQHGANNDGPPGPLQCSRAKRPGRRSVKKARPWRVTKEEFPAIASAQPTDNMDRRVNPGAAADEGFSMFPPILKNAESARFRRRDHRLPGSVAGQSRSLERGSALMPLLLRAVGLMLLLRAVRIGCGGNLAVGGANLNRDACALPGSDRQQQARLGRHSLS